MCWRWLVFRQKCATCREQCEANGGKGAVVQLSKLSRIASCPTCGYCGDRDQHAAMNIEAVVRSLVLTGKRPDYMTTKWMHKYCKLRPRRGEQWAIW
jgi:transposase